MGSRESNATQTLAQEVASNKSSVRVFDHGHRYYDWRYEDGRFHFFEHPVHFTREQVYAGKYVIQTEEPNLSAVDAVRLYKELSEVERAFADLKDVLDMRLTGFTANIMATP